MTCRHWLSLSALEIVSEVRDIRGSDIIHEENILPKYLVNQGTQRKDYLNLSGIKLCSQFNKSFNDMTFSLEIQYRNLGEHGSHIERERDRFYIKVRAPNIPLPLAFELRKYLCIKLA